MSNNKSGSNRCTQRFAETVHAFFSQQHSLLRWARILCNPSLKGFTGHDPLVLVVLREPPRGLATAVGPAAAAGAVRLPPPTFGWVLRCRRTPLPPLQIHVSCNLGLRHDIEILCISVDLLLLLRLRRLLRRWRHRLRRRWRHRLRRR